MSKPPSILFWIDMAWSTFAIAKSIQEKKNFDFYAIVDLNNETKKFCETQNIVDFKKIWFYQDSVDTISVINEEYLTSIEQKYGLNFWLTVYSDRYFYKYNQYYNFKRDEILSIIQTTVKFYENILDEISPTHLILRPFDDLQTELLHSIAISRGIRPLILGPTRVNYKFMISEFTDKLDEPFSNKSEIPPNKSFSELHKMIKQYPKELSHYVKNRNLEKRKIGASPYFFFKLYSSDYKTYFRNFGRTRRKIISNEISIFFRKFTASKFFDNNTKKSLDFNEKFIYFPLHFEPERSLTEAAPFYTNQIEVITNIAKSLPVDYKLVVKEHPFQQVTGWKDVDFYSSILELPNVFLLHPTFPQEEILKKCSLVITIAGTSGLESQFYEKPSILIGNTIYSGLSSVLKLESINDLPTQIKNALSTKVDLNELNNFVNYVDRISFPYDWMGIQDYIENNILYGGFLSVDISNEDMKKFIEKFHTTFDTVSDEFLRKIEG